MSHLMNGVWVDRSLLIITMHFYLLYIILPLVLANISHMVVVKKNWFSAWTIPVSRPLFGANKTLRGFIVVPALTGLALVVINMVWPEFGWSKAFFTGFILGLAYVIAELPNSWIKRKAGVAPGKNTGQHKWLFRIMDKTDSALGVSIAAFFLFGLGMKEVGLFFIAASLIHAFLSGVLVVLGIKKGF